MLKVFFTIWFGIFLIFLPIPNIAQAINTDQQKIDNQTVMDKKSIDNLLGPDINFPFDPSNHRDSSNPIKRIGPISEENY